MATCQRDGCDVELPPPHKHQGQQRKWCSANCRKRACDNAHRAPCPRCDEPMGQQSGWVNSATAPRRCKRCETTLRGIAHEARVFYAAHLYRQGKTHREIAAALGMGPNSMPPEVTLARQRGLLEERRYPEQRVVNMVAGRKAAREQRAA